MSKYVCVIGGINIDIKGIATSGNKYSDSHPGKVIFASGGVARNIAENLSRLGVKTYLFGAIGKDDFGSQIVKETKDTGVNVKNLIVAAAPVTAKYLSVSNKSGFLNYGVNDMLDSLKLITPDYIKKNSSTLSKSNFIVIDTNLSEDTINEIVDIANENKIPVLVDAVSTVKANVVKQIKGNVDYLSVNIREFVGLFGRFEDNQILINRLKKGDFSKYKIILLKMGKSGVWMIDTEECRINKYATLPLKVVEPNGAGDAFNGGFIFSVLNNYEIHESVKLGICCSYFSLTSEKSVSEKLSESSILNLYKEKINEF